MKNENEVKGHRAVEIETSAEIRARIVETEIARNLCRINGSIDLANQATSELLYLHGILDARREANKLQNEMLQNSIRGE